MTSAETLSHHRIIVIDDNADIHEDFRKILCGSLPQASILENAEASLFGAKETALPVTSFEIDSAYQGREGLDHVRKALAEGRPYAMAFVDVRMPPGWDGIETIRHLWQDDPALQIVICTAYSDYSWDDIRSVLGETESLVILKKPFDNVEVLQLAHTLTKKWLLDRQARMRLDELEGLVSERTRNYEEVNERLQGEIEERQTIAQALQQEINERRSTAEALRISEERFAKAFRSSPMPIAIQEIAGHRYVDANENFLQMTGYSREELLNSALNQPQIYADPRTQEQMLSELGEKKSIRNRQCRILTKTGQEREVLFSMEIIVLGSQSHALIITQDITDRLKLENQLLQAQKIEAVGQLAAGIAHDFNNLLTVIQGHVDLRLMSQSLDCETRESIEVIGRSSERAARLTRQLLAFSRRQVMQRQSLDLNQVILDLRNMISRALGENVVVVCDLPQGLPAIQADVGNLEQVLMNLILNARDAMEEGGTLTLRTTLVTVDQGYTAHNPESRTGQYVCLSVIDTGCGMDAATQARIFEPFFTTKDVGKGTGMGLAMVYGILKQHDGWVEVSSQLKQGTTFRLYLPVSMVQAKHAEPSVNQSPLTPTSLHGLERILVVEDEPAVRDLLRMILEKNGYRIVLASNGVEALKVWQEQRGNFDLLLTDHVMPEGISGRRLAETLLSENDQLKVIFSSGYSAEIVNKQGDMREGKNFLTKPYAPQKLLATVRACLNNRQN